MRRIVFKLIVFLLLAVLVDTISGVLFHFMMANAKPSNIKHLYELSTTSKPDIVILGSSRAQHHYIPQIIEDSLQMSCLNYGAYSNGIVLMYGRLTMLLNRHNPRLIVYDIHPPYDLAQDDNSKYISYLRPFSYIDGVDELISRIDQTEKLKCYSSLYRFNSMLFELIAAQREYDTQEYKGYVPQYDTMKIIPPQYVEESISSTDTLKINLFHNMITLCKAYGINLIFLISPTYKHGFSTSAKPIVNRCIQKGIPYKFYDGAGAFPLDSTLFRDATHLNDKGAHIYTKKIIPELRKILKNI